jgi:hypothetical protein
VRRIKVKRSVAIFLGYFSAPAWRFSEGRGGRAGGWAGHALPAAGCCRPHYGKSAASSMRLPDHQALGICGRAGAQRAWRSGACGARRPAQTAPNRRQGTGARSADTREQDKGARAMAHTSIARPCRAASGCAWHALPGWRSRSVPMSPTTRAGQRPAASRGVASDPGGMRLFGDRNTPGSSCCAGRCGPSPTLEVLVAR